MRRRWVAIGAVGAALLLGFGWFAGRTGAPDPPPAESRRPGDVRSQPILAPSPEPRPRVADAHPAEPSHPPEVHEPQIDEVLEAAAKLNIQLGDRYLDEGDLDGATAAFRTVVEDAPNATVATYAAYKLAWCEWNAGREAEAITEMERALDWAVDGPALDQTVATSARQDLETWRSQ